MEKIHFEIFINASKEKVWDTMLMDETYRIWGKEFNDKGCWYEGDWSEGGEIKFLGPSPADGKIGGMVSTIEKNIPYEFLSIRHRGMIVDGVEDTESEEVKKWTPAYENYTFTEENGGTMLTVDMDTAEEWKSMFEGAWPKALQKIKELSEK